MSIYIDVIYLYIYSLLSSDRNITSYPHVAWAAWAQAHLDRTCLLGRRSHIGIQWLDFPLPLVCYELELVAELGLCDLFVGRVCLPIARNKRCSCIRSTWISMENSRCFDRIVIISCISMHLRQNKFKAEPANACIPCVWRTTCGISITWDILPHTMNP